MLQALTEVGLADLTKIISIRAHNFEFYQERLDLRRRLDLRGVEIVVVDDGSAPEVGTKISDYCLECGWAYLRLETGERVFSLSRARNAGIDFARSKWIVFEDADLCYQKDFYQRLLRELRILDQTPFNFLTVPVVYLQQDISQKIIENGEVDPYAAEILTAAITESPKGSAENSLVQHYVPASSVIALERGVALAVGAFDEAFEGWGGEDRDFVFRLLWANNRIDKPIDFAQTKRWNLNDTTAFEGWRSLYRLHGDYLVRKGLYSFHLYHEPLEWRNGRSNIQLAIEKAINLDKTRKIYPRPRKDVPPDIIVGHNPHLANLDVLTTLPNPTVLDEDDRRSPEDFAKDILNRNPNSVIFWNPYGKAWRRQVYFRLRNDGVAPIVAERGALPGSLYFDRGGLCVESDSYREANWNHPISVEKAQAARAYMEELRFGERALERQAGRIGQGLLRHRIGVPIDRKILFVPLQLPHDTVTTHFVEPRREYGAFLLELERLSLQLPPDWVIVYKNHPLSVEKVRIEAAICADDYHVHDLLEACSAVALYNSGVGLLSMAFGKPVFAYGPIYYSIEGVNFPFQDINQLIGELVNLAGVDTEKIERFYSFLIHDFYSWADWQADVETVGGIKKVRVRDIAFKEIKIPGLPRRVFNLKRVNIKSSVLFDTYKYYDYVKRSEKSDAPIKGKVPQHRSRCSDSSKVLQGKKGDEISAAELRRKKLRKLKANPAAYFRDSRYLILRPLHVLFRH